AGYQCFDYPVLLRRRDCRTYRFHADRGTEPGLCTSELSSDHSAGQHGSRTCQLSLECFPAFNYARDKHEIHPFPQGATFVSPSTSIGLAAPVPLTIEGTGVVAEFSLPRGNTATFFLRQADRGSEANLLIPEKTGDIAFRETIDYWKLWMSQSRYTGRWREMVHRSALVLKLLTYAPTGAVVAAAT